MDEFVPLNQFLESTDKFESEKKKLIERIEDRDIPDWMLLPNRQAGEHATGYGWWGFIISKLSDVNDDDDSFTVEARIAWDVVNRHRKKSTVSEVPDDLLTHMHKGADNIPEEIEQYSIAIRYNTDEMTVEDITFGFKLSEESEE